MQVQTFNKACAAVYLSIVQSKILWFWPNTSVEYSDIAQKEEPRCDLKLDDPSYSGVMSEDERSSLWVCLCSEFYSFSFFVILTVP